MPKITRALQKIFGSTAGGTEIGQFGSLAAGTPTYTTNPVSIQQLSNFLQGWYGAVISGASPAIEDMNALFYLITYQLAYLMQQGVPEWNASTEYYIGSMAQDGNGIVYVSLVDNNLNNALTNSAFWRSFQTSVVTINPSATPTKTILPIENNTTFLIRSANGAQSIQLPAPTANFRFTIKDRDNSFGTNNCTIIRNGSESIENLASNYVANASGGSYVFFCDGTNWFKL